MNDGAQMLQTLRDHRSLLLACEAIGWLHMTGKAHLDFLRHHGSAGMAYDDLRWHENENPPFPWGDKLAWLKHRSWSIPQDKWPSSLTEFLTEHRKSGGGLLGLLQAAHGMASGIEKNVPASTSKYLNQDITHMWLASPFGHPVRNLLGDPPALLQPWGWPELLDRIEELLDELAGLGSSPPPGPEAWWEWRERAIGSDGWLRKAFLSTLAETRLPNNDVTLWDQSYVAAALFKSAVAGVVLNPSVLPTKDEIESFLSSSVPNWNQLKKEDRETLVRSYIKNNTCWRVLTVGFGTGHYEARAVKIGDWVGAQRDIERFFEEVRKLIEVDLAVGCLIYRDAETLAFTFPGQRADGSGGLDDESANLVKAAIVQEVDGLASRAQLETPPYIALSCSTRSFVPMVAELRKARDVLAVPLHRTWNIAAASSATASGIRHVCPVCLVRFNEPPPSAETDNARKSFPCSVCRDRRRGRLDAWLAGEEDTIWISEVADANDRVALLTLSFDLEGWLDGTHVDSLRAQSIAEWRRFNPVLEEYWKREPEQRKRVENLISLERPLDSVREYIAKKIDVFDKTDLVLANLQEGYRHEKDWPSFFSKIVEDRAEARKWDNLADDQRGHWLAHQLFRKLPSPGRVHRFWRTAEWFFDELLDQFREIASAHPNRWRVRRLLLEPEDGANSEWEDGEAYLGRFRDAPFELVYLEDRRAFVTIANLGRCLRPEEPDDAIRNESQQHPLELKGDDGKVRKLRIKAVRTPERLRVYSPLIVLDRSPQRFRVLVPLDRATACIEAAIAKWREEFARVWDRMPLRIGVVAFPRLNPFQAVIEAARNLEEALGREDPESWRVLESRTREGVTALSLSLEHGRGQELVLVPTRLPDGREDVFYPYAQVKDRELRRPRDFQHPAGHVYRHMADLRPGDGVVVQPSRIAAVFLDTTGRRFEPPDVRPLGDFERMRAVWDLLVCHAPSLTALRGAWSEIEERSRTWRTPEGPWLPGAEAQWLDLTRAILRDRFRRISGAALETLVEAASRGTLNWALEWHLTWLKEGLEGART